LLAGPWKTFRDYVLTAIAAVSIAMVIRVYWIEAYRIPSLTMSPTLLAGDTIFVSKWPYSIHQSPFPKRGDVVVFTDKSNLGPFSSEYIKRVIGLPGDRVSLKHGRVILNKVLLSKSPDTETLPEGKTYSVGLTAPLLDNFEEEKVPEGHIFVIGDFRSKNTSLNKSSVDSKKRKGWGIVPVTAIKGKATWIWLSIAPSRESERLSQSPIQEKPSWSPKIRFDRMFKRID
jgi:signal peptidase I